MDHITPKQFLNSVFPPGELQPDERVCVGHSATHFNKATGVRKDYFKHYDAAQKRSFPKGLAWYYCVSTVHPVPGEPLRRRLCDLAWAWVLVADDIGTKATELPVAPTYILETSAGNYQWGYALHPVDVSDPHGAAHYDACLRALAEAGYSDPGVRGASRMMRLPGSLHRTGFVARVVHWAPHLHWDLGDLMTALGVTPMPARVTAARPGKYDVLADVPDPLLDWLRREGWLLGGTSGDWVHMECPWRSFHTDGAQGSTSTSYSPEDFGRGGRQFKCMHGHCAGRGIAELLTWAHSRGYMHDKLQNKNTTDR